MATRKKKSTEVDIYNKKMLDSSEAIQDRMDQIISGKIKASEMIIPIRAKGQFGNNWIRPTDKERDHTLLAQCILDSTKSSDLNYQEFKFLHKCLGLKSLTEAERDRFLFKLANKHLDLSLTM